jgi:DNA methylase
MTSERRGERPRGRRRSTHEKRDGRNDRRAVSHATGRIETRGEPAVAEILERAWRKGAVEDRSLTHGLHAYPARLHPAVAREIIASLSRPGEWVVDPFMGSGTVVVEAMAAGRYGYGSDVNPIAVRIAATKTRRLPGDVRRAVEAAAGRIGGVVSRLAREDSLFDGDQPPPMPPSLERWFDPDVFGELCLIRDALEREPDSVIRDTLRMVLSSIAIRVSRKSAETSDDEREGRAPRGAAGRFFADRAKEFGKGLADLGRVTPKTIPTPLVALADARHLPLRNGGAGLVLTSPPYLGTYDYAAIQAVRALVLGVDLADAARRELGSRRAVAAAPLAARDQFDRSFVAALREMARVTEPGGPIVLVIGDSAMGTRFVDGLHLSRDCALTAGLEFVASASEERPQTFGRSRDRRAEHLICLRRG